MPVATTKGNFQVYALASPATIPCVHPPGNRQAGILIPAFCLRREGDLGIGDTAALREWIDWAADHGVGFIQLLPINENGAEESPYSAISSVALDPIYLALDADIPGLDVADVALARSQLGAALHAPWVDYPAVRRAKRGLLERAWLRFGEGPPAYGEEFALFQQQQVGWLDDYCLFRLLMEQYGETLTWDQWPESCRTPSLARQHLAYLRVRDETAIASRLGFFAFVQWLCFRQWRALRAHADSRNVKLMGDVPIGICWHSCDVFFQRDNFHLDWFGGSPPEGMGQSDPFFQQWGQNWGIPLYRWDHMETNGFLWWQSRIARIAEFFQIFRLDHILGFYRIYAFPWRPERNHTFLGLSHEQAAARNGGRLPRWFLRPDDSAENKAANRAEGDVRLRAILPAAVGIDVIAEDLGWVPDYVRPHLSALGIAGYRIPHWDCNEFGHPALGSDFPENSFAAYSTHDHDPVNSIWRGCFQTIQQSHDKPVWHVQGAHGTLRILSEFAGLPIPAHGSWPSFTEGIHLRLIKALLDTNSRFASLMITELFAIDERFNHPGTAGSHNWSLRLPWSLHQIMADSKLAEICRKFSSLIHITRRTPAE